MYIQWEDLVSIRKSLEVFFNEFINLEKREDDNNVLTWATISPEIPNLSLFYETSNSDINIVKNFITILETIQQQKLQILFYTEYKMWYTKIKTSSNIWIEESLYYSNFTDLWEQIVQKIEDFCHKTGTHGFNIEYEDDFESQLLTVSEDCISILEGASSKLF